MDGMATAFFTPAKGDTFGQKAPSVTLYFPKSRRR
jgi:hypothetical protein